MMLTNVRGVVDQDDGARERDDADDRIRGVGIGARGVNGADDAQEDGADNSAHSCSDKEDFQFSFSSSFFLLAETRNDVKDD